MLLAFSQFDFSYDTLVIQASAVHNLGERLVHPVACWRIQLRQYQWA